MNNRELQKKLGEIAGELLREKGYISFVDVFMKLGCLDPKDYEAWRMKRVPFLEKVIKVNLSKINFIMKTVRRNSSNGNLKENWTSYKSLGKGKKALLQFSKGGDKSIEKSYATHFLRRQQSDREAIGAESRD